MLVKRLFVSIIGLFVFNVMEFPALGDNAAPVGLSDPRGLDDPYYRWNAECVSVDGDFLPEHFRENDYAIAKYGKSWDFDKGGVDGISRFSDGIKDQCVRDGKLCFKTGKDPFFYWGNHYKGDAYKGEEIGFNWRDKSFQGLSWKVLILLKQSKPEALWQVSSLKAGANAKIVSKSLTVKGMEWQTVVFDLGNSWVKNSPPCFCSLAIEPGGPDNSVEIDWVKIIAPQQFRYLRKIVNLQDEVKSAALCLIPIDQYTLYINGEKVVAGEGTNIRRSYYEVDCGKYFRKGENVIAYEENFSPSFNGRFALMEGIVKLEGGGFERIYTDKTWKGAYGVQKGWEKVDYDDSAWKPVTSSGNLVKCQISGIEMPKDGVFCRFVTPPYFGPIDITELNASSPRIFTQSKGISLQVKLPSKGGKAVYSLRYKLVDAFTDKRVASGELDKPKQENGDFCYSFNYKPERPGVYNLVVEASENGKILDRHFYELAAVGKIPQREIRLEDVDKETKLRLVDEIHCGDSNDKHPFTAADHTGLSTGDKSKDNVKTANCPIITKNDKMFRETNNRWASWFSYRIKIEKAQIPHMIEVEYLDDRECAFETRVTEKPLLYYGSGANTARNTVGVVAGGQTYPSTGKIQSVKLVYYPRSVDATVDIVNLRAESCPAIHRIKIYEILDMPAVSIPNPSGRMFGSHSERVNITLDNFYDGDDAQFSIPFGTNLNYFHGALKRWYRTYENRIKYMRFSGENLAFVGLWMYDATHYPSKIDYQAFSSPVYDNMRIMFDMFAANDLYVVPCLEFAGKISNNLAVLDKYTDEDVSKGADTIAQVGKDGRQAGGYGGYAMLNPIHPAVVGEAARIIKEITGRYGYSSAFKGVGVIPGFTNFWPDFGDKPNKLEDLLNCDYGDYTISQFTSEMGIEIPVSNSDPERFKKRYDLIMKKSKSQWIEFRNKAMLGTHLQLRDTLNQVKPDAQYYLFYMPHLQIALPEFEAKTKSPKEILRYMSMDPKLYENKKNMNYGLVYTSDHFYSTTANKSPGLLGDFLHSDEIAQMFDMGDNTVAHVREGFSEPWLTAPDGWLWKWSDCNPVYYLAHRYFAANFVAQLLRTTPSMMTFAWQDYIMNIGNQDRIRTFAVPFQSIPMGEYINQSGNGLDKNIVIRLSKNGDKVNFYVVNPYWWDLDVKIGLSGKAKVLDMVSNVREEAGILSFKMCGYGVKVFQLERGGFLSRIVNAGVVPESAEVKISEEGKCFVDNVYALSRVIDQSVTDQLLAKVHILGKANDMKDAIRNAQTLYKIADYYGFMRIMDKSESLKLRDYFETLRKADASAKSEYRINLGYDKAYTDNNGRVWFPDQDYKFGANAYGYVGGRSVDRSLQRSISIKGTDVPKIYETERNDFDAYGFRVPNGEYEVKLHYAETWKYRPDEVSDSGVTINGVKAYDTFSLGKESGGFDTALVKTVKGVKASNGEIYIKFDNPVGARINAIEVIKSSP